VCNQGVHLFLSIFVFISLSGHFNTDSIRNISNTLRPNVFVQFSVNSDISSSHCLLGKFNDFFNSTRSSVLERNSVNSLVKVDCVLSGFFLKLSQVIRQSPRKFIVNPSTI